MSVARLDDWVIGKPRLQDIKGKVFAELENAYKEYKEGCYRGREGVELFKLDALDRLMEAYGAWKKETAPLYTPTGGED